MRIVAALLMVCLLAVPCSGEWIEGSIIGVDANAPRTTVLARIYWGSPQGWTGSPTAILTWYPPLGFTGAPDQPQGEDTYDPSPYAPNTVNVLDVSAYVPPDTKAIIMSNLYLITHGSMQQGCDIRIWFRAYGGEWGHLNGQVAEANIGGNARSPDTQIVAVRDGKLEFFFEYSGVPGHPTGCAYGINLGLAAIIR